MKSARWIFGGVSVGLGLLLLIGAFGDTGFGLLDAEGKQQPAALTFQNFGYDASMDVSMTSNGMFALVFLALGLFLLISANANAWQDTGGEY
jgi:hypothetical protein